MEKKRGGKLIAGGLLLLAMALLLVMYNIVDEQRAGHRSDSAMTEMDRIFEELESREPLAGLIPDYQLASGKEMPTVLIDGKEYAGYIQIPALDLRLPVFSQWSYANLKYSPCCYTGTAYENGFVICAHNYKSHFGKLKSLSLGDEIRFVDMDGNGFDYVVADLEQLAGTDTEEMISGDWALSLFTCTRGGQFRFTVRCDRAN